MHRGAVQDAPSNGGKMKSRIGILLLSMILCATIYASAQEQNTEIHGFYQTYRNFDLHNGTSSSGADYSAFDVSKAHFNGGGFTIVQNIAPWFAMWTQFSFYGKAKGPNTSVGMFNNLEGVRYQTKQHGPFRFFVKGGVGFSRYSIDIQSNSYGSETKLSAAYGGGAQIWFSDHFGVVLDVSHVTMGLPNLSNAKSRDSWDSGLTYTTALAVRF